MRRARVVGSGFAAALAAIALRQRFDEVRLSVRTSRPRSSVLVTGGLGLRDTMAELGLEPVWVTVRPQLVARQSSAWGGVESVTDLVRPEPRFVLDRSVLEEAVLQVTIHCGVTCTTDSEGSADDEFVVDATGRAAAVARSFGAQVRTLAELVATPADLPDGALDVGEVRVESATDGWWFGARRREGAYALYFTSPSGGRDSRRTAMAAAIRQARQRSSIFHQARPRSEAAFVSTSRWLDESCGARWAATGDAVLAADPLSSEGLEFAAQSAVMLRDCFVAQRFDVDRYAEFIRRRIARYRVARQRAYRRARPSEVSAFWQSQYAAI